MNKTATGIIGLDDITCGGLPAGRTTLIVGGPGCGKTILALQILVNGARHNNEPGIFVAFEEHSRRIIANAATFGWDIPALEREGLFFLDAQPSPNLLLSGNFDLAGMLAALKVKADAMGAKRIVFDAVDVTLALLNGTQAVRRELHRLHDWLIDSGLTGIITAKSTERAEAGMVLPLGDFMQFLVDCDIELSHDIVNGVSQRSLRVRKYRGSAFEENTAPVVISAAGIDVAYSHEAEHGQAPVTNERISSGIDRLDTMLGGGFYRGAGILLTGAPGTAKTTLCGAFAEAACRRGEKTLFVSFDSPVAEVIRNLGSVDIRLRPFVESGLLRMIAARAISGSAEIHLMQIKEAARAHGARCVVVDPLSALSKLGSRSTVHGVTERLVDWAKMTGTTLMCSSLLDPDTPELESTPLQISTIADTWIHLSYLVHAGERNRGLSIIKSRGTAHSNQVRELILGETGISLSDVYTAGGEVLMGTLRWAKERAENLAAEQRRSDLRHRRSRLDAEAAELASKVRSLQRELEMKSSELAELDAAELSARDEVADAIDKIRAKRGGDAPPSLESKSDGS